VTRLHELRERLVDKRVAVMLGGMSGEREVSLRSGANVMAALTRAGIEHAPIDPRREDWLPSLRDFAPDAVLLALHGRGGEDGTMQGCLDTLEYRYTGSGVLSSSVAMDKVKTKQILQVVGLPTPPWVSIDPHGDVRARVDDVADALDFPLVVKPVAEGSSLGVTVVRDAGDLGPVLLKTHYEFRSIFAERYVPGMEITVGIIGVGAKARALPVLELVPQNEFYDYEAKYTDGMTAFFLPARLTDDVTAEVQDMARRAHASLGCHGVSRVDMIVTPDGAPYITEINTLPGLTDLSDLPAQARTAGMSYDELILEILNSAFVERLS
jgi:D-alanine-D-alanine ligase